MPKRHHRKPSRLPQFLAILGVVVLVLAVIIIKEKPQAATPAANPSELAEVQLDRALQAGQPTLAFFHSNNCIQCTKMMAVVAQVYPEFDDSVALVDVNVYDESNSSLLQRANIRAIPTQIFFDETGRRTVVLGAMTPDEFRDQLRALAGAAGDCSDESTSGACAP